MPSISSCAVILQVNHVRKKLLTHNNVHFSVRSCLELFCTIPVEFNRENLKVLPQFAGKAL